MRLHPALRRRLQAGLSMIEVLVSLTIVAFGVLGLLGLQARALSFQRDSFDRRAAAEMIAQLSERVRANMMGFTDGNYDRDGPIGVAYDVHDSTPTPTLITACMLPTACTAQELAFRDWVQWIAEYRRRIPGAAAYLQWDAADRRFARVFLAWPEPQATGGADPACTTINGVLGVAIPANYRCLQTAVFP
jgi:type IV pilus assembly protein PilV